MAGLFALRITRAYVEVIDEADGGFVGDGESFGVGEVAGIEVGVFVEEASVLGAEIEVLSEVEIDA